MFIFRKIHNQEVIIINHIKDLSTILALSGARNRPILAISGARWKLEPFWRFLAPEIATFRRFLAPEIAPYWRFLGPDWNYHHFGDFWRQKSPSFGYFWRQKLYHTGSYSRQLTTWSYFNLPRLWLGSHLFNVWFSLVKLYNKLGLSSIYDQLCWVGFNIKVIVLWSNYLTNCIN